LLGEIIDFIASLVAQNTRVGFSLLLIPSPLARIDPPLLAKKVPGVDQLLESGSDRGRV
jgi:hypothetical protein